mgnify:CR=1 FL=1
MKNNDNPISVFVDFKYIKPLLYKNTIKTILTNSRNDSSYKLLLNKIMDKIVEGKIVMVNARDIEIGDTLLSVDFEEFGDAWWRRYRDVFPCSDVKEIGTCSKNTSGTKITFSPDHNIFGQFAVEDAFRAVFVDEFEIIIYLRTLFARVYF